MGPSHARTRSRGEVPRRVSALSPKCPCARRQARAAQSPTRGQPPPGAHTTRSGPGRVPALERTRSPTRRHDGAPPPPRRPPGERLPPKVSRLSTNAAPPHPQLAAACEKRGPRARLTQSAAQLVSLRLSAGPHPGVPPAFPWTPGHRPRRLPPPGTFSPPLPPLCCCCCRCCRRCCWSPSPLALQRSPRGRCSRFLRWSCRWRRSQRSPSSACAGGGCCCSCCRRRRLLVLPRRRRRRRRRRAAWLLRRQWCRKPRFPLTPACAGLCGRPAGRGSSISATSRWLQRPGRGSKTGSDRRWWCPGLYAGGSGGAAAALGAPSTGCSRASAASSPTCSNGRGLPGACLARERARAARGSAA